MSESHLWGLADKILNLTGGEAIDLEELQPRCHRCCQDCWLLLQQMHYLIAAEQLQHLIQTYIKRAVTRHFVERGPQSRLQMLYSADVCK